MTPAARPALSHVLVAMTGASGAAYGLRLLERLASGGQAERVSLIVSREGAQTCLLETGVRLGTRQDLDRAGFPDVEAVDNRDFCADVASGSRAPDAMVIVPCSLATVGALASGNGRNLIHRAADVALKERRRLLLVPRETPLNEIHLKNLLRLNRAGAVVMPAAPAFYTRPETLDDLVDAFVSKILLQLGLAVPEAHRWSRPAR